MADVDDTELQNWWDRLTDDQRNLLMRAVQAYPADPSIPNLLLSTGCPEKVSWAAAKFTSVDGPSAVTLHGALAAFIEEKIDGQG